MPTVAAKTLGCKVNQYDTEAMLEILERAGYKTVPFESSADVYLINTCTVTGTGDQKSLKLIRRVHREHRLRAGAGATDARREAADRRTAPG